MPIFLPSLTHMQMGGLIKSLVSKETGYGQSRQKIAGYGRA